MKKRPKPPDAYRLIYNLSVYDGKDIMVVADKFNKYASVYDASRKRLIPCFDAFYGTLITCAQTLAHPPLSILDLGAGTGLVSHMLAVHDDLAKFHLIDVAQDMLHEAKANEILSARNVKITCGDFRNLRTAVDAAAGTYNLIISALAIHHLTADEKRDLFSQIFTLLPAGGIFLNADQALGETPEIEEIYRSHWLHAVKENNVSAPELAAALERMKEDKMDTLTNQLTWLKQSGFSNVNCWYQNYSFCVFGGMKPFT